MKIKQRKRTAVIKNLRGAYISDQKTKSVYFKLRPLPPRWLRHCRILFKHFLLLGSEGGGMAQCPPPYPNGCHSPQISSRSSIKLIYNYRGMVLTSLKPNQQSSPSCPSLMLFN